MCRHFLPRLVVIASLLWVTAADAQTYGYKKAEDPLIKGVKRAIQLSRQKDFEQLDRAVKGLQWQVDELKEDIGVDLQMNLERAVASRELRAITYAMTELVFQASLQKFHWNAKESLKKFVPARSRVDAAEFYYDEILSHAVRRADKKLEKERHKAIKQEFAALKKSLGSTGLFGVGKREADLPAHKRSAAKIEKLLREVYTNFTTPETADTGKEDK